MNSHSAWKPNEEQMNVPVSLNQNESIRLGQAMNIVGAQFAAAAKLTISDKGDFVFLTNFNRVDHRTEFKKQVMALYSLLNEINAEAVALKEAATPKPTPKLQGVTSTPAVSSFPSDGGN